MAQEIEVNKSTDKLPPKKYDLSVEGNLKATGGKLKSLGGNLVEGHKSSKGYLKCRRRRGRPYWYRVFRIKIDGVWKKRETYLGTRKPRE